MKGRKLLTNNKGAALLYVIMALTVIVAVCVSVTLISTSLYTRTAQTASKEQAFLLAKSIGQCFAQEFVEDTNDKLRYQILDYLSTNPQGRVSASATMYFDADSLSASTANKDELNSLRIANATLSFYLSEDGHYLYGDVTVPYNGVTGTATVVFTYVNRTDLAQNMMDLFSVYNIYSTYPDKLSFNFAKSGKVGSIFPNVYVYNGTDSGVAVANYTLSDDVDANLTANGDIRINSKSTAAVKFIKGKLTGYGAIELGSVVLKGGLYVNGALTVGSSTNYTSQGYDVGSRVQCDIYALNDVTVYGRRSGSEFPKMVTGSIVAEGDVVLYNANVNSIRSSGSVTLVNSYCSGIISSGSVVVKGNSTVDGAVQAGSLTVIDSTINGNITVKSSNSGVITTGELIVRQTSAATGPHQLGTSASSTIRVAGNASFANDSSTQTLHVYGKVYVGGGINSPFSIHERTSSQYPFQTTIVGSLTVMGGIKYQRHISGEARPHTYTVNYLTGLKVSKTSAGDANSGHVTCYWSIPVFSKPNQDVMGNGSTATVTQNM
ncbi:MAG: polymer-forming cytoskeletal protein, partial [Clostridia bacterium]|nr:polymer-forming cytoskeletal protein [Clostridia bacterium]